ncbi:MAG: leucine-rich repeat protein [Oscillospiraceae bacterium]|nr:leucine-rich repeat protein [Oscillospiraceae bacterium]
MKNMKNMFSALTAAAMLVSGMAVMPATAADELMCGSLYYENKGDYIIITDCEESVTTVEIPAEIDGLPVTFVDAYAFEYCENLASITVAAGNTSYCSVDGVLFSADKTVLVEYPTAKEGTSYTIPAGVTELGDHCFSNSILENIVIPDGVTMIGRSAFNDCAKLTALSLPEGVTSIGSDAFSFCYALADINIPSTVTTIDGWAFCYCTSLTEIVLPNSVTSLDTAVFQGCRGLTSITIPESITSLSFLMFTNCSNLTELHLPSTITYISGKIFADCDSVTDVYYDGLQSDWEAISIDADNEILFGCNIHFSDGSVLPGSSPAVPEGVGDLSGDAKVDANDAAIVLVGSAAVGAGMPSGLTAEQETAGDVNADGTFNAIDAALILQYGVLAGTSSGLTFEDFLKQFA